MKKYLLLIGICVVLVPLGSALTKNLFPDYFEIVEKMGYNDVSRTPYEVVEFTIPMEFNDVYERYNNLVKQGGYDLSSYKGRKCKRYTYLIPSENVRANIIVCDGEVIGGDISGITLDSIMIPIEKAKA